MEGMSAKHIEKGFPMEDKTMTLEELLSQHQELQLACQIWIAANDAKDEQIQQLEQENSRLRNKIARMGRVARKYDDSRPRVLHLARR